MDYNFLNSVTELNGLTKFEKERLFKEFMAFTLKEYQTVENFKQFIEIERMLKES